MSDVFRGVIIVDHFISPPYTHSVPPISERNRSYGQLQIGLDACQWQVKQFFLVFGLSCVAFQIGVGTLRPSRHGCFFGASSADAITQSILILRDAL